MQNVTPSIDSFGQLRKMLVDTIFELRGGSMPYRRGVAIAAVAKTVNDNILAECQVTKLSILTEGRARSLGPVMELGQRLIGAPKGPAE